MVIEAGLIVGYLATWAVSKARRVAGRLDGETDAALDAGLDRLHELIAAKLGGERALADLDAEAGKAAAGDGAVSKRTRKRIERALTAAARKDEGFRQSVTELLTELRAAERGGSAHVVASPGARVLTGNAEVRAETGGIAFGQVAGDVNIGRRDAAPLDPPPPMRDGH